VTTVTEGSQERSDETYERNVIEWNSGFASKNCFVDVFKLSQTGKIEAHGHECYFHMWRQRFCTIGDSEINRHLSSATFQTLDANSTPILDRDIHIKKFSKKNTSHSFLKQNFKCT